MNLVFWCPNAVFEKPISLLPHTIDKVILSACALHNWVRKTSPTHYVQPNLIDTENTQHGIIEAGSWRHLLQSGLTDITGHHGRNNYTRQAAEVREKLADYFCNEGAVLWQEIMIAHSS